MVRDGWTETSRGDASEDRLVFVTQQFPPDRSGHASRMHDMTTKLADRGWSVEVVAPPPSFPHGEFERRWARTETTHTDGVSVRRLWAWQPVESDPSVLSRLAYYVTFALHALVWLLYARRRYDVVVTTTPPISTGLAAFPLALSGTPWVVDVRDLWIDASVSLGFIEEGSTLERASRWFQQRVLETADRITVTTHALGDSLCTQYGSSLAGKVRHVPNGVDVTRFRADGGARASDGPPVIIYVGNIGHAQDLQACVEALPRLSEPATLRLVGGGDLVPALREQVDELGLEDAVEFVEPVPREEIPGLLAEAAIGLAPLKDDTELDYAMPTKVYEYLGCGLPVLATGHGELEHFVEASGGGIHVDNDPDAIAAGLDQLLADPDRRAEMGAQGREYVCTEYARERIAARFDEELRGLVGQPVKA